MPPPPIVYPASFSATGPISAHDCTRLEQLTSKQRSELEAGRAYLYAINHPDTPRHLQPKPLPTDYRLKVAAYCQALMDRKVSGAV